MGGGASDEAVIRTMGAWATAIMMIGWATGGIIFGMMSDRWGRVKTMVVTLLVYSGFTGLSGMARSPVEFVRVPFSGGAWASEACSAPPRRWSPRACRANSAPSHSVRFRPCRLAATSSGSLAEHSDPAREGRSGFRHGRLADHLLRGHPSRRSRGAHRVRSSASRNAGRRPSARRSRTGDKRRHIGSIPDLFRHPVWRRNVLVGVFLGLSGMAGLWGIGFFSPELVGHRSQGRTPRGRRRRARLRHGIAGRRGLLRACSASRSWPRSSAGDRRSLEASFSAW